MHIKITKDQLRQLQAQRGSLETDTGRIFVGLVGRRMPADGLYHCDLTFRDVAEASVDDEETPRRFSLVGILQPSCNNKPAPRVAVDPGDSGAADDPRQGDPRRGDRPTPPKK